MCLYLYLCPMYSLFIHSSLAFFLACFLATFSDGHEDAKISIRNGERIWAKEKENLVSKTHILSFSSLSFLPIAVSLSLAVSIFSHFHCCLYFLFLPPSLPPLLPLLSSPSSLPYTGHEYSLWFCLKCSVKKILFKETTNNGSKRWKKRDISWNCVHNSLDYQEINKGGGEWERTCVGCSYLTELIVPSLSSERAPHFLGTRPTEHKFEFLQGQAFCRAPAPRYSSCPSN